MDIQKRAAAFATLGEVLLDFGKGLGTKHDAILDEAVNNAVGSNAWFDRESILHMIKAIGESLNEPEIERWTINYDFREDQDKKEIAVIMAGNIPAVGFHDMLCVLISGHRLQAKLSSDDKHLIPAIADLLIRIEPGFKDVISFTDGKIKEFDAVIATGSNNTSRYFDYYFGKYPHIIRRNRNGVAVLTGNEKKADLEAIGTDIFTYYGLGCRNVSKLMIPADFDLKVFLDALQPYAWVGDHHKYHNNYDYNKSIYLVNGEDHLDNGFLLLKEDHNLSSPVSVLFYEFYEDIDTLNGLLERESEKIQCVISANSNVKAAIPPGTSQQPKLWDYADGVDTMEFLNSLNT